MQGLAVVPLFAGYDIRRRAGRLFQYDVTGGRYEESNFAATGSGSLHAGTVVKIGFREGLDRGQALDLAVTRPVPGRRRGLRHRRSRPRSGDLPDGGHDHRAGFEKVLEPEIADRFEGLIDVLTSREPAIPGRIPETTTDTTEPSR